MVVVTTRENFYDIMNNAWSGAVDVCKEICAQFRTEEAMQLIEEAFCDSTPTETEVNDFIWFDLPDMMNLYGDNEEPEED